MNAYQERLVPRLARNLCKVNQYSILYQALWCCTVHPSVCRLGPPLCTARLSASVRKMICCIALHIRSTIGEGIDHWAELTTAAARNLACCS